LFRKSILFLIRLQNVHLLYRACNINILLFDYRGYGKSTGTPSETGLYTDAQAVYDYVRTRTDLNQDKIFLFGRSLGGAVALHLGKNKINNKYPNSFFFFVKLLILLRQIQHHHYIVLFLKILSHQFLIWLKDYFKFLYLIMCPFGAIKMW